MTGNSKPKWQEHVRRAPLWVIGVAMAVLWSVMMLGLEALQGTDLDVIDLGTIGAGSVVFAALSLGFGRWREAKDRKLPPGPATAKNLNRAIAIGKVPREALAEEWVPGLNRSSDRTGA